ncbi:hypothetical protein ACFU5B_18230 [Streptomyces murinus]
MTRDPSPGRWSTAALFEDAGWGRARELARRVLEREGVDACVLPDIHVIR